MIFIRTDANEQIGMGHVMRCMSLAHTLVERGGAVVFITADHKADVLIHDAGYKTICLDSHWDNLEDEISYLTKLIEKQKPQFILIDSYYVNHEYFRILSSYTKTAYIDDINRASWDVDILINYNIFADVYDYSDYSGTKTKLLITPKYAMLRKEFKRSFKRKMNKTVSDIFVSTGGADPYNITEKIIMYICPKRNDICFHFIVGPLNPKASHLKSLERDNIVIIINTSEISRLMFMCDIAISAAGSTLYELCCTGTPTITYSMSDNQIMAAKRFDEKEIMINAGDCRDDPEFINNLNLAIERLITDTELRKNYTAKMQKLVDGNGTDRIASNMHILKSCTIK